MAPRTRLDKVVQLRERAEEGALSNLARARAAVQRAQESLTLAVEVSRRDARALGPADLWHLDELQHRRAVQQVRIAEDEVKKAAEHEVHARDGYTAARRGTEIVRRVQEKRRAEILSDLDRRERRDADELATLRFNAGR